MALFTFDATDPGWTRSGSVADVQNAGGRMGAWIADVLLLTLGYLAFLFPLIVAVKVYQMFRRRHQPMIWNGWLFSWRLIGFVLTLLAGTALAACTAQIRGSKQLPSLRAAVCTNRSAGKAGLRVAVCAPFI